jgi:hypothetical protein
MAIRYNTPMCPWIASSRSAKRLREKQAGLAIGPEECVTMEDFDNRPIKPLFSISS